MHAWSFTFALPDVPVRDQLEPIQHLPWFLHLIEDDHHGEDDDDDFVFIDDDGDDDDDDDFFKFHIQTWCVLCISNNITSTVWASSSRVLHITHWNEHNTPSSHAVNVPMDRC